MAIMVFAFSIGVSAADATIYLQKADWTSSSPVVTPIGSVTVTGLAADATLKDAIEAASTITATSWTGDNDEFLQSLTFGGTPYTNQTLEYIDLSDPSEEPWTHGYWEGVSWMWFSGDPGDIPASPYVYPSDPLGGPDAATIAVNPVFTLTFDTTSFTW